MSASSVRPENVFYQHELGLLENEFYESTFVHMARNIGARMREVGALDARRQSFVREVERILTEADASL